MFAIGDVANIPGAGGRTLPQLGSVAQQSGRWAAKNIRALRDGPAPTPFHYHDKGIMAMIGRNAAVAEIGAHRHQVEGPFAFAAWLGLHAVLLSGFHTASTPFLNWADDYFHHARAARARTRGLGRPDHVVRRPRRSPDSGSKLTAVQFTSSGWALTRPVPSPGSIPSIAAISAAESSKSKTSRFSSSRSRRTDFGKTTNPFWMCQRSTA